MAAEAFAVWLDRAGVEPLALEFLELGLLLFVEYGQRLRASFGRDLVELLFVGLPPGGLSFARICKYARNSAAARDFLQSP